MGTRAITRQRYQRRELLQRQQVTRRENCPSVEFAPALDSGTQIGALAARHADWHQQLRSGLSGLRAMLTWTLAIFFSLSATGSAQAWISLIYIKKRIGPKTDPCGPRRKRSVVRIVHYAFNILRATCEFAAPFGHGPLHRAAFIGFIAFTLPSISASSFYKFII
ncbi:hypothetical protein V5799_012673 [Amblyomma americanum]|uniref:Uncharacterized protein n=1 Tax=Amblyomma americanum TaxID=6943 RepID=A0AAQ4EDQ1_AMBAM